MRRWMGVAVLLATTGASAQTVVDGSGSAIPAARLQQALRIVSATFPDPKSTTFRKLASNLEHTLICGEVNAKTPAGAEIGYRAFHMVADREPVMEPEVGDPDSETFGIAMENCRGPKP